MLLLILQDERPASEGGEVSTYQFSISYDNVDIEDLDQLEVLVTAVPYANFVCVDGRTRVDAALTADSAIEAVETVVEAIRSVDKMAEPTRVELSLMTVSDIAELVGLNREAVRLWTIGKRGPGGFPAPLDSIGDRVKVWAASDVHHWLRSNSVPCPEARPLSVDEVTDATRAIERLRHGG
jgi:predicted DNA-binding transcriptional regulator AlpA